MLGAGNAVNPKVERPSLTGHIDLFDDQITQAQEMLTDLRGIGDRLDGGRPRDAGRSETQAAPSAIIPAIQVRHQALTLIFHEMREEIGRIQGLL